MVLQGGGVDTVPAPADELVNGEGWQRLPDSPVAARFQHLGPLGRPLVETPWAWVAGRLVVFSGGVMEKVDGWCCNPVDGGYTYTPAPGGTGTSPLR